MSFQEIRYSVSYGANADAYISWAKSIEGIGDVRVISTARGLGTVDVVCVGVGNIQPSDELIESVQALIDEKKPISSDVEVKAPTEVLVDTNISVVMLPNYALNQDLIKEAVINYFASFEIGSDFEPSALISYIFAVDGVKSVVVNSPESTKITELQIARTGEIVVSLTNSTEE